MTQQRYSYFVVLVVPLLIIALASLGIEWLSSISSIYQAQVQAVPYLLGVLSFVLAIQYYQHRTLLAAWAMTLGYIVFWQLLVGNKSSPSGLYWGLMLILPLQLALLSLDRQHPLLSKAGIARLLGLGLPYALLLADQNSHLVASLMRSLPEGLRSDIWPGIWLTPLSLVIFVSCAAIISWRIYRLPCLINGCLLASLVAVAVALTWLQRPLVGVTMFVGSGLALVVSLFIESWAQAYRDELTGLPSRRALMSRLQTLRGRYTLAMVDVDNFKSFNDRYGHDTGDDVLRIVAQQIAKVGHGGKAYRFGGEEFVILFPGKRLDKALPALEQLRKLIAGYPMVIRDQIKRPVRDAQGRVQRGSTPVKRTIHITVSIGVAQPDFANLKPESVFKMADEAVYQAKAQGRNQVVS